MFSGQELLGGCGYSTSFIHAFDCARKSLQGKTVFFHQKFEDGEFGVMVRISSVIIVKKKDDEKATICLNFADIIFLRGKEVVLVVLSDDTSLVHPLDVQFYFDGEENSPLEMIMMVMPKED